jgi:Family of unknown function (DUF6064)
MLPFTRGQFLAVFADYNAAVWPAQIVAYLLGLAMVVALLRPSRRGDRFVAAGLALMWIWTGAAYHAAFFAAINAAAMAFAALFVVQGLLFAYTALAGAYLCWARSRGPHAWLGWSLVAYSAAIYPLIGLAGHGYPAMPMFGITPCPVTLFTFGVLLLATGVLPRWLLVIPLLWSLVGGSAAFLLGVPQDWPLLFGGLLVTPWLWRHSAPAIRPSHA